MVPDGSGTAQPTAGARLVRPYNAYILILTLIHVNYSLIKINDRLMAINVKKR